MGKATQPRAQVNPSAQTPKAPKAPTISNVEVLVMPHAKANVIAVKLANATLDVEKALGGYAASIIAAAKGVKPMTEAQYASSVGAALTNEFRIMVAQGVITQETAASRRSQLKTVFLAVVNGYKPAKGMSLKPLSGEASDFLKGAKIGSTPVLTPTKTGKTKGRPAAPKGANGARAQTASGSATPTQAKNAFEAAALIIAQGSKLRAERIGFVFKSQDLSEQFDTWAATVLAADPK